MRVVSTGTTTARRMAVIGSGIEGLRERVTALSGILDTSVTGDTFTLSAAVPVTAT